MNFIKRMTICGLSAVTLSSAPVSANSLPVPNFKSDPDFGYSAYSTIQYGATEI